MKIEQIYEKLDEIREMVSAYQEEDGTVPVDAGDVQICTSFFQSELQRALERGKAKKQKLNSKNKGLD